MSTKGQNLLRYPYETSKSIRNFNILGENVFSFDQLQKELSCIEEVLPSSEEIMIIISSVFYYLVNDKYDEIQNLLNRLYHSGKVSVLIVSDKCMPYHQRTGSRR